MRSLLGQTSFQGLTPGTSTRNDVARVLGQPVRTISTTLFEYKAPAGFAKVEVGYRAGSSLVERIEVYFIRPISVSALSEKLALAEVARLGDAVADEFTAQAHYRVYEEQALLALTFASSDLNSG